MHCIILAAGTSSRLRPLTQTLPKCLLPIGGRTILERAIAAVLQNGIERFTIVVGFQHETVEACLRKHFPSLSISPILNREYQHTNTAYSLLCARDRVQEDELLLMDGDVVFDEEIIQHLVRAPSENCLALRSRGEISDEEVKVQVNENNRILRIGKELELDFAAGESIGIQRFSRNATRRLFDVLEARIQAPTGAHEYYEAAFQQLIDQGVALHAVDVEHLKCIEIDTHEDLQQAQELFIE